MKIVKLHSENIKRLKAVEVNPGDNSLVIVGGVNDAGKSSVLDSIFYALGGGAAIPEEPIRRGESQAKIEVDLGSYVVTRKFWRDRITDTGSDQTEVWGPTKSSLVIRSKDNAVYSSPQAMLDKILTNLSFDPLEFARMKPQLQLAGLKELVQLDTSDIDKSRAEAFEKRTEKKREHTSALAVLNRMPSDESFGFEVKPATAITDELQKADHLRQVAEAARQRYETAVTRRTELQNGLDIARKKVTELQKALHQAEQNVELVYSMLQAHNNTMPALDQEFEATRLAVPDVNAINNKLQETINFNRRVEENLAHRDQVAKCVELGEHVENLNKLIADLDARREKRLAETKFPIEGLSFGEAGVLFNGLPFEQASTSQRIKVSAAIGLALNPELKILLVRDGNALDDHSLQQLGELAEAAGAQVWLEYVTAHDEGVTVMIEDGTQIK